MSEMLSVTQLQQYVYKFVGPCIWMPRSYYVSFLITRLWSGLHNYIRASVSNTSVATVFCPKLMSVA